MISLITQPWVFVFMCSTPLHQPGNHGRLFRMAVTWPVLFWIIKYTWALTHTHRNSHLHTHTHTQNETLTDTLTLLYQTVSRLKSFSHFRMKQEWGSQFPAMYNEPTHTPTVPTSTHTHTDIRWHVFAGVEHVLLSGTTTARVRLKEITFSILCLLQVPLKDV